MLSLQAKRFIKKTEIYKKLYNSHKEKILMTTSRQVKANRKNAIKGGVKTEAGKAISSQNATKYGFFSKITTEFDKLNNEDFCKSIYNCFMPVNEYENQMVEILLSNLLTFRRICLVEKEYLETKIHPDIEMDFSTCLKKGYEPEIKLDLIDELNKFQKYKTSIQNNLIKIEHELERLVANRNSEYKYIPNSLDINVSNSNGFVLE